MLVPFSLKKAIHYPFYVKSVNFVNLDHSTMGQLS